MHCDKTFPCLQTGSPVTITLGDNRYLYYLTAPQADGHYHLASALHGHDRFDGLPIIRQSAGHLIVAGHPTTRIDFGYDEPLPEPCD